MIPIEQTLPGVSGPWPLVATNHLSCLICHFSLMGSFQLLLILSSYLPPLFDYATFLLLDYLVTLFACHVTVVFLRPVQISPSPGSPLSSLHLYYYFSPLCSLLSWCILLPPVILACLSNWAKRYK